MFAVTNESKLHPWDYLGGMCIAIEAGGTVVEYSDLELVVAKAEPRRIVAAATGELAAEVLAHGIL
jgi:fructose-1,6-bisphosphatase/inositol monophosphatase family enzyme